MITSGSNGLGMVSRSQNTAKTDNSNRRMKQWINNVCYRKLPPTGNCWSALFSAFSTFSFSPFLSLPCYYCWWCLWCVRTSTFCHNYVCPNRACVCGYVMVCSMFFALLFGIRSFCLLLVSTRSHCHSYYQYYNDDEQMLMLAFIKHYYVVSIQQQQQNYIDE